MNKLSSITQYIFFIAAGLCGVYYLGVSPSNFNFEHVKYDRAMVSQYTADQARKIVSGRADLGTQDLEALLKYRTMPYEKPPTITEPSENKDCK